MRRYPEQSSEDVIAGGHPNDRGANAFPNTRLSAIIAAASPDPNERRWGLETLAASYWIPVYRYLRFKWGKPVEDAEDLTQGFFAGAIEKSYFRSYDPSKARFRTFLRACLDAYVSNQEKSARRIKRGGKTVFLDLDFEEAEVKGVPPPNTKSPEDYFEQEWIRGFFSLAVECLEKQLCASGKETHFRLFHRYLLEEPDPDSKVSYKDLAIGFGLTTTQVTNYLALARREFRNIAFEKLRQLTASDEEFRREARSLLGTDPP
jgi:DNA-directed RNA polymerase specialized sigma24 family protein